MGSLVTVELIGGSGVSMKYHHMVLSMCKYSHLPDICALLIN